MAQELVTDAYTHEIVASTSVGTYLGFEPTPSISRSGAVSFIAKTGLATSQKVLCIFDGTSVAQMPLVHNFSRFQQINNTGFAAAQDFGSSGGVVKTFIRVWSKSAVTKIAEAGVGLEVNLYWYSDPVTGLPIAEPIIEPKFLQFDVVYAPSLNKNGEVVYVATGGNPGDLRTFILTSASAETAYVDQLPGNGLPLRPMIADDGSVVVKRGTGDDLPILLYKPQNLVTPAGIVKAYRPVLIAGIDNGFDKVGDMPAISDDGRAIVFYGRLTAQGAQELNLAQFSKFSLRSTQVLTSGEGIFISLEIEGKRLIQKVTPDADVTSLQPASRSGIGSLLSPSAAFVGQRFFTIVYLASINGRSGLYSQRLNLLPDPSELANVGRTVGLLFTEPLPIALVGDVLYEDQNNDGIRQASEARLEGTVSELGIHDPVGGPGMGTVTFWVKTSAQVEAIIRSTPWFNSPWVDKVVRTPGQQNRTRGSGNNPIDPTINQIILHATGGSEAALWQSAGGAQNTQGIGPHYGVSRQGRVTQFVQERFRANHAANEVTPANSKDSNNYAVGIELVDDCIPQGNECQENTGHRSTTSGWATEQTYFKGSLLVRDIGQRKNVPLVHLVPNNAPRTDNQDFVIPQLVLTPFESYDGDGDGLPDFSPGADPNPNSPGSPIGDGFYYTARGVISHGQVINRRLSKDDPKVFDWRGFMARVNGGIGFALHSPADLLLTDALNRRVGFDPVTRTVLMEIPGATYSGPGSEPETISIPFALEGGYSLAIVGTGVGNYSIDIVAATDRGGAMSTRVSGDTTPGQRSVLQALIPSDGSTPKVYGSSNLPPVALDDFVSLPLTGAVEIAVLQNDSDPDGDLNPSSIEISASPRHGTVQVSSNAWSLVYTPTDSSSADSFTYTVRDNAGLQSNPAVVHLDSPVGLGRVERRLPTSVSPGVTFTASIAVDLPSYLGMYSVLEFPPVDSLLSGISDSGQYDPTLGAITWGPLTNDGPRVLRYSIAPVLSDATLTFRGVALLPETDSYTITGDTTVALSPEQAPFRITGIRVSGGFLQIQTEAPMGMKFVVEGSSDLMNWRTLTATLVTAGAVDIPEPATNASSFFRLQKR